MSAASGRRILRSLFEPALKGTATAGKILVCDSNTNITGLTLTNPVAVGGTSTASMSGTGSQVGSIATGSYSQVSNTTLANVTGMTATLAPGTYIVDGYMATTNNGTGGIKIQLTAGGGLTTTTALFDTWVYNTTTLTGETNSTTIGSPIVNAAIASTAVFFGGTLVVSVGGTIQVQAAQNTSNGTALTVANGSYITFNKIA